jgi:hypothetical protein
VVLDSQHRPPAGPSSWNVPNKQSEVFKQDSWHASADRIVFAESHGPWPSKNGELLPTTAAETQSRFRLKQQPCQFLGA